MNHLISDEQLLKYAQSAVSQTSHLKPSLETKKMLDILDKKLDNTDKKLELHINDNEHFNNEMSRKLDDIREAIREQNVSFEKSLESKAGKWVEKAVSWAIYLIMAILLSAIVGVVIIDR